ncbi:class I SAM-dependent methyltransferase [Solwaraspora sp. WMMA2065]|uniref:class I SAM-dependent methyltransferase n=1 Tax=Solwaraspora sp. WMMA2065 TaxID=3015166 RepID=UPI00259BCF8B|nr:class I SAM-dependent methyltransferase [Solwaraspora sp. WMMA2065]WJK34079.1 class I SAM-dependent methyltransferase [Solwaraspora sp. WMMA2065]
MSGGRAARPGGARATDPARPVGEVTRGTTAPNRLRRADRWIAYRCGPALTDSAGPPLVVDLGFGAHPVTTVELAARLRAVRPDVRVVGLEIDPDRVTAAAPAATPPELIFGRGGFELAGLRPVLVRAFNVLRQYAESDVATAWATMRAALAPGGLLVEGTCDEPGRVCSWVLLDATGPVSLTLAGRLATLAGPAGGGPAVLAERLPKALIHRNVPGERVHALLRALDESWRAAAGYRPYGPRQRWLHTVSALRDGGWPVLDRPARWRLGELTVPWSAVAPTDGATVESGRRVS